MLFYICLFKLNLFLFDFLSHFSFNSLRGDCFEYKIRFDGTKFPPNGPVMQKKTLKWEPSTENMYERDGVLKGDVSRTLLLEGGGHYQCDFKTMYK